jgi:hypothetical protein
VCESSAGAPRHVAPPPLSSLLEAGAPLPDPWELRNRADHFVQGGKPPSPKLRAACAAAAAVELAKTLDLFATFFAHVTDMPAFYWTMYHDWTHQHADEAVALAAIALPEPRPRRARRPRPGTWPACEFHGLVGCSLCILLPRPCADCGAILRTRNLWAWTRDGLLVLLCDACRNKAGESLNGSPGYEVRSWQLADVIPVRPTLDAFPEALLLPCPTCQQHRKAVCVFGRFQKPRLVRGTNVLHAARVRAARPFRGLGEPGQAR